MWNQVARTGEGETPAIAYYHPRVIDKIQRAKHETPATEYQILNRRGIEPLNLSGTQGSTT